MNPEENKFDVIVVGTGPGGAIVAKELSNRRKKVLMLEWGDYAPLTGTFNYAFKNLLFPGKGMLFTNQMLGLVRGIDTGGSTVFYYGIYFPIPFELFKSYNIDLTAEDEELRKELPIAPLKEEMIGPMTQRIMDSAQDLGYDWQKLDKIMYQDEWKPEFEFSHYGDRYNIKWSARMHVAEALTSGASIINKAKVEKVIFDNNTAVGVEYRRKGVKTKVFAPLIILSAGGIGTPLILRASGIRGAGYDFFFDPLVGVRGTAKDINVPLFEIPMSAGILMKDEGYLMADMAHPAATLGIFAAQVFRFDQLLSRRSTFQIIVKAKDTLGGHLTDNGRVRKKLIREDKQKLLHGYERAKEILKNAGVKNIFKTWYLAAHPGGTAKIGEIVDSNLKTEYDNLYVCDCSVIPEAWGLPPVSTILALGKRLAKHLSNR